jgi:hypothetical protein
MWVRSARFTPDDGCRCHGLGGHFLPAMGDLSFPARKRWIRVDSVPALDHFWRLGFECATRLSRGRWWHRAGASRRPDVDIQALERTYF